MNLFTNRKIGMLIALFLIVTFPSVGLAQVQFSGMAVAKYNCTCSGGPVITLTPGQGSTVVYLTDKGGIAQPGICLLGWYTPVAESCQDYYGETCVMASVQPQGTITTAMPSTGNCTLGGASGGSGSSGLGLNLGTASLLLGVGSAAIGAVGALGGGSGGVGTGAGGATTGTSPISGVSDFVPPSAPIDGTDLQNQDYLNENGVDVYADVDTADFSETALESVVTLENGSGASIVVIGGNEELSNTYNSGKDIVNVLKNSELDIAILKNTTSVARNTLSNAFIVPTGKPIPAGQYYDESKGTGNPHWRILFTR